jgi:two-component system, NarL family, invasion response regulator UvrY
VIRVIVADDHAIVRDGLSRLLIDGDDARVVATAANGEEAVARALETPADVLVLDLGMPGGGIGLVETIHGLRPLLPILVYTMQAEREWGVRCLLAGARGFVPKAAPMYELGEAVLALAAGRRHIGPELADELAARMATPVDDRAPRPPHESLSNREHAVFLALARGEATAAIAATLGVSSNTVTTYRARVLEKLGAERNADLTRYAIRHGLIT